MEMTYAIQFGNWTKIGHSSDPVRIRRLVRKPDPKCRVPIIPEGAQGRLVGLWEGNREAEAHRFLEVAHPHIGEWFKGRQILGKLRALLGPELDHGIVATGDGGPTVTMRVSTESHARVKQCAKRSGRTLVDELGAIIDAGLAARL